MIELLFFGAIVLYVFYNIPIAIASDRAYKRGYRQGWAKGREYGIGRGIEGERDRLVKMLDDKKVGVGHADKANAFYWVRIPMSEYTELIERLENGND